MANFVRAGQHMINLDHVVQMIFSKDEAGKVEVEIYFDSLEERLCTDCGQVAEGLQQAWMGLRGEAAQALHDYMTRTAADARTPVPAVFRETD